jgi:predicted O-methyltransferase YrrM
MARRTTNNLDRLAEKFGSAAATGILTGESVSIGGVEFVSDYRPESTAERFFIIKPLTFVERFVEVAERFKGGNLFELGIAEGGSTALLAIVAEPKKLVAVDLESQPLDALDEFIEARGLGSSVRPYYGVDQSDRPRLTELIDLEFGGGPLDLVIDDCSHELAPTLASFEALFPRLRPGGVYAIEDWNADHVFYDAVLRALRETPGTDEAFADAIRERMQMPDPPPRRRALSEIVLHLWLARASSGEAVAEMVIGEHWVLVTRGPGQLDPEAFRLQDRFTDHFGYTDGVHGL